MKIKFILISMMLMILSGCTMGYATKSVALPKNYRIVSISDDAELKADLLDMYDFNMYYNQTLSASCRGVVKVGDYVPFLEETTTTAVNGMEIKKLTSLFADGSCVKASKDAVKSGFDS